MKYAEDLGQSSDESARLVLYMGVTVAIGRFAGGFLCSFERLNNWSIFQGILFVNGVSMMLITLVQNYEALVAYALVFGFCDGAMATVFSIQSLSCVDQSRAASAYGYLLLIASVTSLVGPPISGGPNDPWFINTHLLIMTQSRRAGQEIVFPKSMVYR